MKESEDNLSFRKPDVNPYNDPELIGLAGDDAEYLQRMVAVKLAQQRLEDAKAELVRYQIENNYLPAPPPDDEVS